MLYTAFIDVDFDDNGFAIPDVVNPRQFIADFKSAGGIWMDKDLAFMGFIPATSIRDGVLR